MEKIINNLVFYYTDNMSDFDVNCLYNEIFGNPQYDSFMVLPEDVIQEIRERYKKKQTIDFISNLL